MLKKLVVLGLLLGLPFQVKAAETEIYRQAYEFVSQNYVAPLRLEDISIKTLQGLHEADTNLRLADDGKRLTLYHKAAVVRSFYKPQSKEAAVWAELSADILKEAKRVSKKAKSKDFELPDITLKAMIKNLDADSKYYLSPEDSGKDWSRHQRHFASREEDGVLYIKIVAFNKHTFAALQEAVKEHQKVKGIILDLRGSPGGLLNVAIDIADAFLDEGIIVSQQGREDKPIKFYNAKEGNEISDIALIVLVDGKTASAAEVLAAALQEQGRAKVVGSKSFGKGSIQELKLLPNNSEIALTTAYFYTPSGRKLHQEGIMPDICTAFAKTEQEAISAKNYSCEKEGRENKQLDIDIAKRLIAEKSHKPVLLR